MALGLLDRCCSAETMMRFPAIYKMSQNRSDFNIKVKYDLTILVF
jgi:phospholipid-transporting ATPase